MQPNDQPQQSSPDNLDQSQQQPQQTQDQTRNQSQDQPQADEQSASQSSPAPDPQQAANNVGESVSTEVQQLVQHVQNFIEDPTLSNAADAFLPPLLAIGEALLILATVAVVCTFIARYLSRAVAKALRTTRLDDTVANFIALVAKIAVWLLAIPIALGIFGVDATSLAALIGAAALAIGLALQGSLSNIAAGVILAILRPMKHGDYVEVGDDDLGVVHEVGIFYSVVRTFNNIKVFIPNAEVLSSRIENYTQTPSRRLDIPVGVAYGTDLRQALETLQNAAENDIPSRHEEQPRVFLREFGDSAINFEVQVFSNPRDFLQVRHETVLAVDEALKANNITIAFPQRDVHFPDTLRIKHAPDADNQPHHTDNPPQHPRDARQNQRQNAHANQPAPDSSADGEASS